MTSNNVQPFEFEGNKMRTSQDKSGNPLFCARDAAIILGYTNPNKAIRDHTRGERIVLPFITAGGTQEIQFITEGDLYRLIASSKLPAAQKFEKWIYDEVLPSIRRHGVYATDATIDHILNDPDFGIKLLTNLKDERARRREAERAIEAQKPKVLFADSVAASHSTILVGELAKILKGNGVDIGQNRLFQWMRDNGYLISRKGTDFNMPTQKAMELGLFFIKETNVQHSDGHITVNKTPKVTGKGQSYFVNKFLANDKETDDVRAD
jgi:anti-repressor protein|nr:MAG TPA: repressor domain protein [Caudoviricetes sp.]